MDPFLLNDHSAVARRPPCLSQRKRLIIGASVGLVAGVGTAFLGPWQPAVLSLVGVVLTLVAANHTAGALKAVMTATTVLTVVVSWLTVHTIFTLRYARL